MQPGTILSGKYRLHSVLGRGGMGSVWRAEHLGLEAPVAVKLMDPLLASGADGLERFHREAHAAASIRSPHVVQVLDHGVDEPSNTPYIVMELLEGETLGDRLDRERTLSPAWTTALVVDLCRALTRAHQAGIVHRDLKPDNIFLVRDEREFPKLLDFGVAKSHALELGSSAGTRPGSLVGTPCYMSPEQISAAKHVDGRSDLWSLAVITYECFTGRRLFEADSLAGMVLAICGADVPSAAALAAIPAAFQGWFVRALHRDPAQRFQSARELGEALEAARVAAGAAQLERAAPLPSLVEGRDWSRTAPTNVLAPSPPVVLPKRVRRTPAPAVVAALVVLAAGVIWAAVEDRAVIAAAGGPATEGPAVAVPPAAVQLMGSTHALASVPVPVADPEPAWEAAEVASMPAEPASDSALAGPAKRAASKASIKPRSSSTRRTRLQDALEGDRGRSSK